MKTALRAIGQFIAYVLFAVVVGYLATAPAYYPLAPGAAMIKLSFSHAGARIEECRQLSPEEIAQLPPNMRNTMDCPRERLPVFVQLELDGEVVLERSLPPAGMWHDGASSIYHKITVAPGRHWLTARLRDSARSEGFDYERMVEVDLVPQQNFVVDFRADSGGFLFLNDEG